MIQAFSPTSKQTYLCISMTRIFCRIIASFTLLFAVHISALAQRQIEILGADELEYDAEFGKIQRCKGNVRFRQDNALMRCDSAWFYEDENRIEAFGNIHINQQDTLNLWGDYLEYNGDTKKAVVRKNVRLSDRQMTLRTQAIEYLLDQKIGYYTTGGEIENSENRLKSVTGTYYAATKTFYFRKKVHLWNKDYTMDCDTLQYNTLSRTAYFYGPTWIRSDENTIFCNYGWYNTFTNKAEFSKRSWITSSGNLLLADSLVYNRNTNIGRAFGNIVLHDTSEKVWIYGNKGESRQREKRTWVYGNAYAVQYNEEDTLLMKADTLYDFTDTSSERRSLSAFGSTKIFRSDMQGICDSLVYGFSDSSIQMFDQPVLWNENNQITGDTMVLFRKNSKLERLEIMRNAMVIAEEDSLRYNQIKGRNLTGYFAGNRLNQVWVKGNGESVYHAREEDGSYSGVNAITCSQMLIELDSSKVKGIRFYTGPEGTFYPPDELPEDKKRLPGYQWLELKRPKAYEFSEILTREPEDLSQYFE